MRVESRKYEFAHGRKPRGMGNWAFIFDGEEGRAFFVNFSRYAEAKKEALAEAKRRGARRVEVGS